MRPAEQGTSQFRGLDERERRAGTHLGLGVLHGRDETRDVVAEALGDLVLGGDGEHGDELEGADLAAPLGVGLDVDEELLDHARRDLGRREALQLLGRLLGRVLDARRLAGLLEVVEDAGQERDVVRVDAAERLARLAEQLVERDHGALLLERVLGAGGALEVLEDAVGGEGPNAVRDDVGGDRRGGRGARRARLGLVQGLEEGRRGGGGVTVDPAQSQHRARGTGRSRRARDARHG